MVTISFIYEHINYLVSGIYNAPIFNVIEFTDIIYLPIMYLIVI